MSISSFSQMPGDVRFGYRVGRVGDPVSAYPHNYFESLVNELPQAAQVSTVTVDTAANSTAYSFSINGVAVSYTSDSSATKPEISDGLAAAVKAEPLVSGVVTVVDDGVDTLTLTARTPGEAFTLAETDANLSTATTTSAVEAEAIPFGRAIVCPTEASTDGLAKQGGLAGDGKFSAQVQTMDYTYNGGDTVTVRIYDAHTKRLIADFTHTLATSKDASTTALAAGLNALLPDNTVLAANAGASGYELTMTAEEEGYEFYAEVFSSTPATVLASVANTTGPSPATSFLRAFRGFSRRRLDVEVSTVGGTSASYKANEGFVCQTKGRILVEIASTDSISNGDAVYVELDDSGSVAGRVYNADGSATRYKLPGAQWVWAKAADGVGCIEFDAAQIRGFVL